MTAPPPPPLDGRDQAALLAELEARVPGYVPGWELERPGPSRALARVASRYLEVLASGLDRVLARQLLAFLDSTGARLLPAESGRAPMVFTVMPQSPVDPLLPAGSQVAAPVAPRAPSPLAGSAAAAAPEPVVFATTAAVTLTRSRLAALYSLAPGEDQVGDHLARAADGFTLFGDLAPVEHAIYLGHDRIFALAGSAEIRLFFRLRGDGAPSAPFDVTWEYLSADGWLPLELAQDTTDGLVRDGEIRVAKTCGPDAMEQEIGGRTSYWLRGRLRTPLLRDGYTPTFDSVGARVVFAKADLVPEAALSESSTVDVTRTFYPFGPQPEPYATFYLGSREVFQRGGARVELAFELAAPGVVPEDGALALVHEYWDGERWQSLDDFDLADTTKAFTEKGKLTFRCPPRWTSSRVAGTDQYWLRVRIADGDYGHPLRLKANFDPKAPELEESTLAPPAIASVSLGYTYQTEPTDLEHCFTFNDFAFTDATEDCRWPRRLFQPFQALASRDPAVYFGFDRPLPAGLISLFAAIPSDETDASPDDLAFVWEYLAASGWSELGVLDETQGFRRSGMIQLVGPPDAVASDGLGGSLYRIRARLKQGRQPRPLPVAGVWLNAVWVTNRLDIALAELGTSDGNVGQTFHVQRRRVPVLAGERVEVREWTGSRAGWEAVAASAPPEDVRLERDPQSGAVRAVWVRWHERPHLLASGPGDRVYVIERSRGKIEMGGDGRGAIPPAGARIVISYATGDGVAGNVAAGAIAELRSGVPYLDRFGNPVAADGGAATETIARVSRRGAERLRHRDRAVTARDYEWLAHDASPAVARARCLSVTGPAGAVERGHVTLVVLPHDPAPQPQPSPALRRGVADHLAARMPASAAGQLRVIGPSYCPVGVVAEVVVRRPEEAAQVEARLLEALAAFLHPLGGGADGQGWDFGQPVSLSQIARLLEGTAGVDCAPSVALRVHDELCGDWVQVAPGELVASGDHELKLTLRGRC